MKKYILTFEIRYTIYKDDDQDYCARKFTIGEFLDFNEAVKVGNGFVECLKLNHSSTPGINGDRLGTPIIGKLKNTIVRNYLRNDKAQRLAEIFIKINTTECVDSETALKICDEFKSLNSITQDPLKAN